MPRPLHMNFPEADNISHRYLWAELLIGKNVASWGLRWNVADVARWPGEGVVCKEAQRGNEHCPTEAMHLFLYAFNTHVDKGANVWGLFDFIVLLLVGCAKRF